MSTEQTPQKTIAQKLGVRSTDTVRLVGGDATTSALIHPLPEGAVASASEPADVAVVFVADRADLHERFATDLTALPGARAVWIAYRKGNVIDMNRNTIMTESENYGWETVANVSLGDEWSAVRVKRLLAD